MRRHEKFFAAEAKIAGKRQTADRATRQIKTALDALHTEVRNAESFFGHIHWLQERFPKAKYEDVTGLCKLADRDEIKEQDYSLNPGRYVGVVIEKDGKTEEEFLQAILDLNEQLATSNSDATKLSTVIDSNISKISEGT